MTSKRTNRFSSQFFALVLAAYCGSLIPLVASAQLPRNPRLPGGLGGIGSNIFAGLDCRNPLDCAGKMGQRCLDSFNPAKLQQCMQRINPGELANVKDNIKKFGSDLKRTVNERRADYLTKFSDLTNSMGQINNNINRAYDVVRQEAEQRLAEYEEKISQFEAVKQNIAGLKGAQNIIRGQADLVYPQLREIVGNIEIKPDTMTALTALTGRDKDELLLMKGKFEMMGPQAQELRNRIAGVSINSVEAQAGEKLNELKTLTTQDLLAFGAQIAPLRDEAALAEAQLGEVDTLLAAVQGASDREAAIALVQAAPVNPQMEAYRGAILGLAQKFKPRGGGGNPALDADARKGIGTVRAGVAQAKAERGRIFRELDAQYRETQETINRVSGANDHVTIQKSVMDLLSKQEGLTEELFDPQISAKTVALNSLTLIRDSALSGVGAQNLVTSEMAKLIGDSNAITGALTDAMNLLNGFQAEKEAKELALGLAQTALTTVLGDLLGDLGQLIGDISRDLQYLTSGLSDQALNALLGGSLQQMQTRIMSQVQGCLNPVMSCVTVAQVLPIPGAPGQALAQLLRPFLSGGALGGSSGGFKRSKIVLRSLRSEVAFERMLRRTKVSSNRNPGKKNSAAKSPNRYGKETVRSLKKLRSDLAVTIAADLDSAAKSIAGGQGLGGTLASVNEKVAVLTALARQKGYL